VFASAQYFASIVEQVITSLLLTEPINEGVIK
jgi:hypothetical protein